MSDMDPGASPPYDVEPPIGLRFLSMAWTGRRSRWLRAEQISLERTVALKYLHPALAENEGLRETFFNAARQAASIVHPAALSVFNIYPQHHCIAMQWAKGQPLRELRENLEPVRLFSLGESVMDALSSLHATGRCHGNLAPGNVFLGDNEIEIGDFFHPPLFNQGDFCFVGEKRFIAPETLAGAAPDWLSDVFSLGRLLAFAQDPAQRNAECDELIETLCATDPNQRGASPQVVLESIRRLRRKEESRLGREAVTRRRGKRMYRRVPAEFDVSLRRRSATPDETAVILMKIRDIGESGVFVETEDELIGIGSILELDFSLKGVDGNIHAFGVVRWRSSPPLPPGVGVQFVEVDQIGLAKLRQFLMEKEEGRK